MSRKKKEDIKDEVSVDTTAIKNDLMAYVDVELDKKLEKAVGQSIKKNIIDEIEKANKKVIRMKNHKIILRDILLLVSFIIIILLIYLLYLSYCVDCNSKCDNKIVQEKSGEKDEGLELSLDDLKEKYASYLDSYILSDKSVYLEDFYQGRLSKELKNYFSLNQMNFDKLDVEEDYNIIDSSKLKDKCLSLFHKDCGFVSFDYNGNRIRYFEKLRSFISNTILLKEDSCIQREIIDIQENKNSISITTLEAIVIDGQLYSIEPNSYIGEYNGEGLQYYSDQLNKMTYKFKNKKLVSIEKE